MSKSANAVQGCAISSACWAQKNLPWGAVTTHFLHRVSPAFLWMKVRLNIRNRVDFVLIQTVLQMKKHSAFFSYFIGLVFFSPGILCCQINCSCGGSRGPSRGQRDHIFILQSPFYDHVQISQGNLKHSTPSLQEMGPPSGARSPTHIPTLPPSVKEAIYIVVECWLSLAQSQDFRTLGACTM